MYDYIKGYYGRAFSVGQTVYAKNSRKFGTVVEPNGNEHYVRVRLDGNDEPSLFHPADVEPTCSGPSTSGPRYDTDGRKLY